MKIALIVNNGFEELEALGIVDMARRLDIQCDIVGFCHEYVTGSNRIKVIPDVEFHKMADDYDAIVLPGGPGAYTLRDNEEVIRLVQKYNAENKVVAAICAAPVILEKAGVIKGKKVTCYPSVAKELVSANYQEVVVQTDGNIVTGKGPAATFAFAFAVLEALGLNTNALREGVQYNYLINKN
jgi:4-methyl-5(b-hydroxyethyl)-thiazole monophosphate biosynthesis